MDSSASSRGYANKIWVALPFLSKSCHNAFFRGKMKTIGRPDSIRPACVSLKQKPSPIFGRTVAARKGKHQIGGKYEVRN